MSQIFVSSGCKTILVLDGWFIWAPSKAQLKKITEFDVQTSIMAERLHSSSYCGHNKRRNLHTVLHLIQQLAENNDFTTAFDYYNTALSHERLQAFLLLFPFPLK